MDGGDLVIRCFSIRTIQPRFLRDPEMSMLCSLVDIVPASSAADRAMLWSKEAVEAFASMIGNKAMLLTVCELSDYAPCGPIEL